MPAFRHLRHCRSSTNMAVGDQVAALAAAGNDIEALEQAIKAASHLDEKPGDDRQKLRAARTKLKKLHKDAAAKEAATTAASKERSPHAKESYDTGEYDKLVAKYEKLNWRMISKPGGATVKPDDFYSLYGLAQQVSEGDNKAERPMWAEKGGLDFEGRARWDAWTQRKGLAPDKAKAEFVKTYYEFLPKALYKDER